MNKYSYLKMVLLSWLDIAKPSKDKAYMKDYIFAISVFLLNCLSDINATSEYTKIDNYGIIHGPLDSSISVEDIEEILLMKDLKKIPLTIEDIQVIRIPEPEEIVLMALPSLGTGSKIYRTINPESPYVVVNTTGSKTVSTGIKYDPVSQKYRPVKVSNDEITDSKITSPMQLFKPVFQKLGTKISLDTIEKLMAYYPYYSSIAQEVVKPSTRIASTILDAASFRESTDIDEGLPVIQGVCMLKVLRVAKILMDKYL